MFSSKGMEIIFLKSSKSPGCFSRSKPCHTSPHPREERGWFFVKSGDLRITRKSRISFGERCSNYMTLTWVLPLCRSNLNQKVPTVWINSRFPASVQRGKSSYAAWKVPLYTNTSYQLSIYMYICIICIDQLHIQVINGRIYCFFQ